MEISAKYDPAQTEDKWYAWWLEHKFFHSEPDGREPYVIVIPPPNVTGVLHMGHMMNNTLQDVLIRRARMLGKNALWVPGTDHASIATEAKVVGRLAAQGIRKQDLTREQFLEHAWDWTREHGGIILKQLRRLGASCDWDRTAFTMDEIRSESVLRVFRDLYDKGLIYRGLRMVNWDPKAQTALSNIEVVYKEEHSKLFYLRYYVADQENVRPTGQEGEVLHQDEQGRYYAVVATTRPETIMGDTAMCINPKDPKNQWLRGHKVIVPLVNRVIPVIEDRYVDIEFGTGCLKVTPAHDVNDYNLGKTHNLETIDIFNPDGTISNQSPLYVGLDRNVVRKQIAKDLEAAGLMEKVEDYLNKVGYSERNQDTAVEPRLCKQWYVKMRHLADIALKPVLEGEIKFYPEKFVGSYRQWLENIDDWCISRQLWWGHRIPAYYLPTAEGEEERFVVALSREEALEKARQIAGYENIKAEALRHDEDALDTWFSSWLWPISLFDGIRNPDNPEIKYYYPTSDLVTAPDIIFFWVARMIMAGEEYMHDVPYRNVYFTGIVRDKLGRKMSKQLGNSPDPIGLIEKYGADGVRLGILLCTSAGNDILFDETQVEQGRNFSNKIWNAFRLVKGWTVADVPQSEANRVAVEWFRAKLAQTAAQTHRDYENFRINDAVMGTYKCFWDDFCAWYLELVNVCSSHYRRTLACTGGSGRSGDHHVPADAARRRIRCPARGRFRHGLRRGRRRARPASGQEPGAESAAEPAGEGRLPGRHGAGGAQDGVRHGHRVRRRLLRRRRDVHGGHHGVQRSARGHDRRGRRSGQDRGRNPALRRLPPRRERQAVEREIRGQRARESRGDGAQETGRRDHEDRKSPGAPGIS